MASPATRRRTYVDERSAAGRPGQHPNPDDRRRPDRQTSTASKGSPSSMNASTLRSALTTSTNDLLTGERTLSRRTMVRGIAGLSALALVGRAVVLPTSADAAGQTGPARATDDLNLRSGPGTGYKVLRLIPNGAQVNLNGRMENGYQDVTYDGTPGWAHGDYLKALGSAPPSGVAYTSSSLNLRSGPSTGHQVLRVMPAGAKLDLSGNQENGFWYVTYQGQAGWAYGDYILVNGGPVGHGDGPGGPLAGDFVTTTALNLRAEPSLSAKVLKVMPTGVTVFAYDVIASGFRQVSYNGVGGWAWNDYLKAK
jgi:uncharacterized protein YraI